MLHLPSAGLTTIHPSQRRVACKTCRKQKAKCQRLHENDPSCVRCTLYGVKCTIGRQRKVGRPRPANNSAGSSCPAPSESSLTPCASPTPAVTSPNSKPILDMSTYQISWMDHTSSTSIPSQVLGKVVDDVFGDLTPTWSPSGMALEDNDLFSWDTAFDLNDFDFLPTYNPALDISPPNENISSASLLQSPPSTVSSDQDANLEIPEQRSVNAIDDHTALMELSKINIDLHARVAAAKSNKSSLRFDDLVYRQGPLYIDNYTLTGFVLETSQRFLRIITSLLDTRTSPNFLPPWSTADIQFSQLPSLEEELKSQQTNKISQGAHSPTFYRSVPTERLSTPLALIVTSIFAQLMSLYGLMLEYTTARVARLSTEPMSPVPILTHGGQIPANLCSQGALISRDITYLLESMLYVLGIESGPSSSRKGLLTTKQAKALWSELDSRHAIIPGQTVMEPAVLQRLFGKMETVLERIAADSIGLDIIPISVSRP